MSLLQVGNGKNPGDWITYMLGEIEALLKESAGAHKLKKSKLIFLKTGVVMKKGI